LPKRWTSPAAVTACLRWGLLALLLLALAACRREPEPVVGAPAEPVAAVEALAEALREGDLARYAQLSVPPSMQAAQEAAWRARWQGAEPPSEEQAARYAEWMRELTAEAAEDDLMAKAEPRLAQLEQELGPKWSVGVAMLAGFAHAAIAANEDLSAPDKAHARGVVTALSKWAAERAAFTDRERARAAIAVAARTARELDLPTLEAVQALDYAPMLEKAGIAFRGAKDIARAYGVDLDAALSEVQAEVIRLEGDRAVLRVRYPLLGETVAFEQAMLRIDGGWYREDAIEALRAVQAPGTEAGAEAAAAVAAPPADA
jgi:hypothetical protein